MANPAIQRSGETESRQDGASMEGESPAPGMFAGHSTADLIELRNRLLEECLDLESRAGDGSAGPDSISDEQELVREKIDEIHQELALRDLAERVGAPAGRGAPHSARSSSKTISESGPAAHAARKAAQILEAIEMRSRFMDELAQAARDEGRLDQAAAFALNAQKLDMERVDVLRQLNALSGADPGADD